MKSDKTGFVIVAVGIALIGVSIGFIIIDIMSLEERTTIAELEDKVEFLENKPDYKLLETELERVNNENQELASIISDVIEACNNASNGSHQQNNKSLEKENEVLQELLNRLKDT